MLKIQGTRNYLYQWDLNQKVIVVDNDSVNEVHFVNEGQNDNALIVEVKEDSKARYAEIPNILLQSGDNIVAYEHCEDNGEYTFRKYLLEVIRRPKPADYVYTETEIKSYEALQADLDKKIDAPQTAQVGEVLTVEEIGEDGKPTKWKTAPAAAEQKQADWNQNDETAADYVKNRPFYERIINGYVDFTYDTWESLNLGYPFAISLKVNGNEYKDVSGSSNMQYLYYYCDNYTITVDRGREVVFGDENVDDLKLYVENYREVRTLSDEYIPGTIARTEQIVKPDWNIVNESAPGAILNKPQIGWENIYSRSGGVIPTFTIPSNVTGWILKIKKMNIENYSEGDIVYIIDGSRKIQGTIIQGNNLMIRGYKSSGYNDGTIVSIVTKGGTDYMTQVVACAIDFFGWSETKIKIYASGGKTITCDGYDFVSV